MIIYSDVMVWKDGTATYRRPSGEVVTAPLSDMTAATLNGLVRSAPDSVVLTDALAAIPSRCFGHMLGDYREFIVSDGCTDCTAVDAIS